MSSADASALPRAVIASGAGRYADPWHPFAHTSARIAEILDDDGWHVTLIHDPDAALASLDDAAVLVVNAGDPWHSVVSAGGREAGRGVDPRAQSGLDAAIERGIGVIAVHSALASLRDYPAWRTAIGGEWQEGRSWHPPAAYAVVPVSESAHPVTAGLTGIALFDELYTDLVIDPGAQVLVAHTRDAASHPLVWVREHPTRAVVTAFGHDERSYESASHQALIRNAARWAGAEAWSRTGRMDLSPAHLPEE
ncbi:ThuA domain-containing protein [Microbacterium deminutum]|uniref:ThuA-like domain-containing protein n=1 Tax=Microbacterium deminutum TaxID=344164 RepID=A0ABN2QSY9_9MICO